MANRFPLIVNQDTKEIQELKETDNLDLSSNGIYAGGTLGSNGQVLTSNGATVEWRTVSGGGGDGGGASNLNDLTDVSLSLPLAGQVLKYNGTLWTNSNDETGGLNLNDLTDVTLSETVANNQLLRYDASTSQWKNWSPTFLTSETSHADVVVDGDFPSTGLMRRGSTAGSYSVITDNSANWNTAFSWGNHATAGYLTTVGSINNCTDVTISAVSNNQLLRYNSASSQWENWTPNYLSSYTETDPVFQNSPAAGIDSDKILNWDTAYGWGNHATQGYFNATTLKQSAGLNSLNGVTITNPTQGQVIKYNGTTWVNGEDLSEGGNLNALSDVTITTAVTNQLLRYNGTEWVNWTPTFLTSTGLLDSHTDVTITSPSNNQLLRYNGTDWVNWTPTFLTSVGLLDNHTDVTILNPEAGQVLKYNGTDWVNSVDTSGVSGPSITTDNAILRWNGTVGGSAKNSSVTIADNGAITAPSVGNVIPFYYTTQANFPDYATYRGALAWSLEVNRLFVANASGWGGLANTSDAISVFSDVNITSPSNNQLLRYDNGTSEWKNWTPNYLTAETDPVFSASPAAGITNTKITNWDTSFSWGNHATQGYIKGLPSRTTASAQTTGTLTAAATAGAAGGSANLTITAAKSYSLFKIVTSSPAWVTIYCDSASRTNDSTRNIGSDPAPGSGIIAEVITTTGGLTQIITPGTIGWNNDATPSTNVYIKVTNTDTTAQQITVTLTYLKLED